MSGLPCPLARYDVAPAASGNDAKHPALTRLAGTPGEEKNRPSRPADAPLPESQLSQQRTKDSNSQSLLPLPYLMNQIVARLDRKNMAKEALHVLGWIQSPTLLLRRYLITVTGAHLSLCVIEQTSRGRKIWKLAERSKNLACACFLALAPSCAAGWSPAAPASWTRRAPPRRPGLPWGRGA